MRGAVSLAAALALPLETDAGAPLPERDLILFLTFAVILVTLVGQGLTLPLPDPCAWGCRTTAPRRRARRCGRAWSPSRAALERLDELAGEEWTRDDTVERLRGLFEFRQRRFKVRAGKAEDEDGIEDRSIAYQRLMHELLPRPARARRAAQRRHDLQRGDAPDRARARPRGVAAGGVRPPSAYR